MFTYEHVQRYIYIYTYIHSSIWYISSVLHSCNLKGGLSIYIYIYIYTCTYSKHSNPQYCSWSNVVVPHHLGFIHCVFWSVLWFFIRDPYLLVEVRSGVVLLLCLAWAECIHRKKCMLQELPNSWEYIACVVTCVWDIQDVRSSRSIAPGSRHMELKPRDSSTSWGPHLLVACLHHLHLSLQILHRHRLAAARPCLLLPPCHGCRPPGQNAETELKQQQEATTSSGASASCHSKLVGEYAYIYISIPIYIYM